LWVKGIGRGGIWHFRNGVKKAEVEGVKKSMLFEPGRVFVLDEFIDFSL
jgi:hypothetical protein